ncbi:MAG TPA: OmpH family outer membrane protein [Phenylobacterium sp.]
MTFKPFAAGLTAVAAMSAASAALAQAAAPAAAPAQPAIAYGAPIPGVCTMSPEAAMANSQVGNYVGTRMKQIVDQANAELNGEKTQLDNEAKALDARRASTDQNTWEQQAAAIQVRANAWQRKAQLRDREIQATDQKAENRIFQEMEPLIKQVFQQRACSILLNRGSIVVANPAMDITPQVVTALNGRITQFAFDREHLDQVAPGAAAGGAPPIVQTPSASRPAAPAAARPAPKR